ncbi:MAG: sporulation protein [Candidatus Odinarchaeota archaeon]|nr:sporulation protein [Candidatus Odinarchaeota archaeon]
MREIEGINLFLRLDKVTYRLGEEIKGGAIVESEREITVTSVYLRLLVETHSIHCAKIGGRKLYNAKYILAKEEKFSKGEVKEFPFRITIPNNLPPSYNDDFYGCDWSLILVFEQNENRKKMRRFSLRVLRSDFV